MKVDKSNDFHATPAVKTDPAARHTGSVKGVDPVQKPMTSAAVTQAEPATKVQNVELEEAIEKINKFLAPVAAGVEFAIDHDSGKTIVKVVDTETNTVLRQYPTDKALQIAKDLARLQGSLLSTTV